MSDGYTYRLGVLGAGAMGSALLRGFLDKGVLTPDQVLLWEIDDARREAVCEQTGVKAAGGARDLVSQCETILVALKPQVLPEVLPPLQRGFHASQLVISIAAGVPLARLAEFLGETPSLVRVMPNVLCTVGESASAWAADAALPAEQVAWVDKLLSSVGLALRVEERLMDAVTGLSGSAPAFAAAFCEALTDGGVAAGLPRGIAVELAAQVLVGAGTWIREHHAPAALKDLVTSPGGTTIAGLRALEAGGLRAATMEAVLAAAARSAELGRG
ncbi:MAG TPA: pyrroline-5-carboxylate reductase [Armatimonadota bacterium]